MKASEFFKEKRIIGMVHCLPLPGTLGYCGDMEKVKKQAIEDAITLEKAGIGAIIVENNNDGPYGLTMDKEQICALAAISALVKERVSIPVGVDCAFCDYEGDIAIAVAIGADFVRIPVFVDTIVNAAGIIQPCCREVIKYRKALNAENVALLCDVQVKHSYMLLNSISIEESATMAQANGADAIIVTGKHTGLETPIDMIKRVKNVVSIPVVAGSGFNKVNAKEQLQFLDGAIVGSAFKEKGILTNPIKFELVKETMDIVNSLKGE
ncbi:MAG: BtpA/SgcQ family protein [Oscillospiraceae bacterium]